MSSAQRAANDGTVLAQAHGYYGVKQWLLYQSRDPFRATHAQAGVDAVIVETPYERIRYESFLDRLQGKHQTAARVRSYAMDARRHVGFVVFAHSRSENDRSFLTAFHSAALVLSGGVVVHPSDVVQLGPSLDFFDVGSFREERWIGTIAFRFSLPPMCEDAATLRFTDSDNHPHALQLHLARYP